MAESVYERLATYYDGEIIEPLRQTTIARKIMSVDPKVKGDDKYFVDIMSITGMNAGVIEYRLPDDVNRDMISTSTEKVQLPFIAKGFQVPKQDIAVFAEGGIDIEAANAKAAAWEVQKLEEAYLLQGWKPDGTNYEVKGLYQAAGNTCATSYDFGTYGNATDAVCDGIQLIEDDNIRGTNFNLLLNSVQKNQLKKSKNSTTDAREWKDVMELLNENGGATGQILTSEHIAAGTGLLVPVDPARNYFDIKEPQPIKTVLGYDSKLTEELSPVYGTIFELLLPNVKRPEALCTLTGI